MNALDRLKQAIFTLKKQTKGLTNKAISSDLGYKSVSYLSDVLGGSKPISEFMLDKLMIEFSINKKWILEGEGEMFIKINAVKDPGIAYEEKQGLRKKRKDEFGWAGVPVFNVPLTPEIIEQGENDSRNVAGYVTIPLFKDCAFGIQASGDNMSPAIRNGDHILCKEVDVNEIIMGDAYVVLTYKGTEVIRYVYPHTTNNESILLVSDDKSLPPTELAKSSVRKIYKVKGVIKSY